MRHMCPDVALADLSSTAFWDKPKLTVPSHRIHELEDKRNQKYMEINLLWKLNSSHLNQRHHALCGGTKTHQQHRWAEHLLYLPHLH